ncbi:hypothetical protein [Nonomuraea sp. CA-141351]|uniref:hypothetical protein n=1 Tax=Nonomuraea sp. CA-141351 TaxID=3239996 RepID=UPI003D921F2E
MHPVEHELGVGRGDLLGVHGADCHPAGCCGALHTCAWCEPRLEQHGRQARQR